jgi:hypothetical protein
MALLSAPQVVGTLRLEPIAERHRAALKAACAEDEAIWPIYSVSYDPGHFEGIIPTKRIAWNGHVRDTALFSILAGEWAK